MLPPGVNSENAISPLTEALPFVPPDCTSPVILQATLAGHQRPPEQFDDPPPCRVRLVLGRRVDQCKTVFLGGPDVLLQPSSDIRAYLEAGARHLPITTHPERRHPDPTGATPHTLDGIHAFLDQFDHDMDWKPLRARGLVRVSIGVESGDRHVRSLYGKTWPDDALRASVSAMKADGIGVSPLVFLGAGGSEHASAHLAATSTLIASLDLGPGDIVALVDAEEFRALTISPPTGFTPLIGLDLEAQRDTLKTALSTARSERKFDSVVTYSF